MSRLSITVPFVLASLVLASAPADADWALDNDASTLKFVTTKANLAAEVHSFGTLEGSVDGDGNATVTIELDSVDTTVEIRDERMREMLFETERYPAATIAAKVDTDAVSRLKPGTRQPMVLEGQLLIRDTPVSVTLDVTVTKLDKTRLLVSSRAPVIVNAGQTGLAAGVEKLREVAGLPSISPAVPVTFELVFVSN